MKIISYNLNGIRSAMSKGLVEMLKSQAPDVFCIQETKAQPDQIDTTEFEAMGYHCYWHSAVKKGYSGVGILTKIKPKHIEVGCNEPKFDQEGRVLRVDFDDLSVYSIYFPSGTSGDDRQAVKMDFLSYIQNYLQKVRVDRPNLVVTGDFNICHKPIDIHDPVRNKDTSGFKPEEREWVTEFLALGYEDSFRLHNPEPHQYTWWSYRAGARGKNLGWRIDYQMITVNLKSKVRKAGILSNEFHSDHCPTVLELD